MDGSLRDKAKWRVRALSIDLYSKIQAGNDEIIKYSRLLVGQNIRIETAQDDLCLRRRSHDV